MPRRLVALLPTLGLPAQGRASRAAWRQREPRTRRTSGVRVPARSGSTLDLGASRKGARCVLGLWVARCHSSPAPSSPGRASGSRPRSPRRGTAPAARRVPRRVVRRRAARRRVDPAGGTDVRHRGSARVGG